MGNNISLVPKVADVDLLTLFSLVSKAALVAILTGLLASLVLSTFSKPTLDLLIPEATLASVIAPSASFAAVIKPSLIFASSAYIANGT